MPGSAKPVYVCPLCGNGEPKVKCGQGYLITLKCECGMMWNTLNEAVLAQQGVGI